MWLILVGLILIGASLYYSVQNKRNEDERTLSAVPATPVAAYVLYGLSVVSFGAAAYLFYNVPTQSGWYAFSYVAFSIGSLVGGVKAIKAGYESHQKHATNMEALARAKGAQVTHKQQLIALENARRESQQQAEISARQRAVEKKRLEADHRLVDEEERTRAIEQRTRQRELGLRQRLADVGDRYGLDVDGVVDVNKHQYKSEIDLNMRGAKVNQDLAAADQLDSTQQRQIINQLRTDLENLLRKRSQVEKQEKDEFVKQRLLARYDKDIDNLEAEIDARGSRLVSPENGKENRRLT